MENYIRYWIIIILVIIIIMFNSAINIGSHCESVDLKAPDMSVSSDDSSYVCNPEKTVVSEIVINSFLVAMIVIAVFIPLQKDELN